MSPQCLNHKHAVMTRVTPACVAGFPRGYKSVPGCVKQQKQVGLWADIFICLPVHCDRANNNQPDVTWSSGLSGSEITHEDRKCSSSSWCHTFVTLKCFRSANKCNKDDTSKHNMQSLNEGGENHWGWTGRCRSWWRRRAALAVCQACLDQCLFSACCHGVSALLVYDIYALFDIWSPTKLRARSG